MTYQGGLAEVTLNPVSPGRTEVKLGDKLFFDLISMDGNLIAEYKPPKRDAIRANPSDLLKKISGIVTDLACKVS